MTNELGLKLNLHSTEDRGDKYSGMTLGAFRRGKYITWIPGATIDVWTKCARTENATGVPWPHAMFIQTIGGPDGGHILCPPCRAEVAALRASGRLPNPMTSGKKTPPAQLSLF